MEQFLFIVSATIVINWLVKMICHMFGQSVIVPVPILHLINCGFTNTYLSTPGIAYQVYFWANYFSIFGAS